MKPMPKWCIAVMLTCLAYSSNAQQAAQKKSSLFSRYPSSLICPEQQLSNLFKAVDGQTVKLSLPNNLVLQGTVKNKINKYGKIETLFIQLPAFNNILLAVSRRLDHEKQPVYKAHLFSENASDGYELKRDADNIYRFEKIEITQLRPLCNQ